jgi:hypothetical protein
LEWPMGEMIIKAASLAFLLGVFAYAYFINL